MSRKTRRRHISLNPEPGIVGLDFDTATFLDWRPDDPENCDVWATAHYGSEKGVGLFQIHICTQAAMNRIESKQHCFVIEKFISKADLITRLDSFAREKTRGHADKSCWLLAKYWRYEYRKYDKRGNLLDVVF